MKHVIPMLQLGDRLRAVVEEVLSNQELIVNCSGDLIRVKNDSGVILREKNVVTLTVTALQPLQFKVEGRKVSRPSANLDISI